MQLLMAGIEEELTRRICNAVDRSNPKKWRRTVPERAPHWLPSDRHGQILAKSRELTGDQFNVTLCNLQWQGSKESSRDASGTPWIAPILRNDDEPCLGAHLIGSHRIGMVRAPPKWVQIDSDSSF